MNGLKSIVIVLLTNFFLDINECEDPAIAARCVANAECCNIPAHFFCRCLPGYQGDGEVECKGKFFVLGC